MANRGLNSEKKIIILGILFVLVGCLAGCSRPSFSLAPERTPEDIVEEFYERYFQCINNLEVTMLESCLEVQIKRPYLTKSYRKQIQKSINSYFKYGGYDPLLCAYNIPPGGFKVGSASLEGERASLVVSFYYEKEIHNVPITLVKDGNQWKIENVDCRSYF